jgi:hypothetical protein
MKAPMLSAARHRSRRRVIRAAAHDPHLTLEYDIASGLFTVSMGGLSQETVVVKALDTILGDARGKASLFIFAVQERMWCGR